MSRINAKDEFLRAVGNRPIKCAIIEYVASSIWRLYSEESPANTSIMLKQGWNEDDLVEFLDKLDFTYDAGYGSQELDGTIWFAGSNDWMTRWEYDGSEGWSLNSMPPIPEELKS